MIPVTLPFLPPREEYEVQLQKIWESNWLTNMGPLSCSLEEVLKKYLQVPHLFFVTNGTIALQMAIKALDLKGEIITTPFSFVATASSIVWEGCTPVFVDIDKNTLNIDATKIEAAITPNTSAILATHVYGNPCDIDAIAALAQKHRLKVIYDGAHAFGVLYKGKSVFEYGDIATCSLHATKLFHTTEGGLIVCKEDNLAVALRYIRNFGISGFDSFATLGINGKNSELHAAMGLANFNHLEAIHEKRKLLTQTYKEQLEGCPVSYPYWNEQATQNYAYFPVLFSSEEALLAVRENLLAKDIQTRRYFYPSLAKALPYVEPQELSVTEDVARRVLCLPFYYDLSVASVLEISKLIKETIG